MVRIKVIFDMKTISGRPIEIQKVKESKVRQITESAFTEIPYLSDYIFNMNASYPDFIEVDLNNKSVNISFKMEDNVPLKKVYEMIKMIIDTGADSWMEGDISIYGDEEMTYKIRKLIKYKI